MQNSFFKKMITAVIASMTGLSLLVIQPLTAIAATEADSWYDWAASVNQTSSALSVNNLSVSKTKFDPAQGGTAVNFNVNGTASTLSVVAKDSKGNVKTNIASASNATGSQSYVWSGSGLSVGVYTIEVTASSSSGLSDMKSVKAMIVPAAVSTPDITNIKAVPATISANQSTVISYDLKTAAFARITVQPIGSPVLTNELRVAELLANVGTNSWTWDGKNDSGSVVAAGDYTVMVSVFNTFNNEYMPIKVTVTAAGVAPQPSTLVTSFNFAPASYVVNSVPVVTLSVSQNSTVTFSVNDTSGNQKFSYQASLVTGSHTIPWNGKDSAGNFLPAGTYSYALIAINQATGAVENKTGTFTVTAAATGGTTGTTGTAGTATALFTSVTFAPSVLNPTTGSGTLSFNLGTATTVTFTVRDQLNSVVYVETKTLTSGAQSFVWNGKKSNGEVLQPGTYSYTLTGVNPVTALTENSYGTFSISTESVATTAPCTGTGCSVIILNPSLTPSGTYNPLSSPLNINYFILGQAYVTVTIFQDQYTVKQLKISTLESNANTAVWDGRNMLQSTGFVNDGTYRYRIVASYNNTVDMKEGVFNVSTTGSAGSSASNCAGFKDVKTTSIYCNAVAEMKKLGIFTGYSDGTFRPTTPINRAETVKVMMTALKYNVPLTGWYFDSAGFKDVYSGAWYTPYLAAARLYGVIHGYPDKTFKPEKTVNRAEMSKIFLEASNIAQQNVPCVDQPYKDKTKATWFAKYACITKYFSLVEDVDGKFEGVKEMGRGDVAIMIYRAQQQSLLKTLPPKAQINFSLLQQNQFPFKSF